MIAAEARTLFETCYAKRKEEEQEMIRPYREALNRNIALSSRTGTVYLRYNIEHLTEREEEILKLDLVKDGYNVQYENKTRWYISW